MNNIYKAILDLWAEYGGCQWRRSKGGVKLITYEDTMSYATIEEAANDCLYTIGEWLKEGLDPKTVIETYLRGGATLYLGTDGWYVVENGVARIFDSWNDMLHYMKEAEEV